MEEQQPQPENDNTFAKEALICEIGAKLQQAREAKGLSKEQVLQDLKFNASFLDALEEGRWSAMPGEVYALGFLRQYASLLGLDFSEDIERIKSNKYELTTPLTYPDAPISPNRTWAIVAALLFILGILVSNLFGVDEEPTATTEVQQQEQLSPPPSTTSTQGEATLATAAAPTQTNLLPATSKTEVIAEQPSQQELLQTTTPESEKTTTQQLDTKPTLHAYTFKAVSDDVWLQIFEQAHDTPQPVLKREALLRKGQSFSLDTNTRLLLTAGKPTALEVRKDGQVIYEAGSLGEANKVLKLFKL